MGLASPDDDALLYQATSLSVSWGEVYAASVSDSHGLARMVESAVLLPDGRKLGDALHEKYLRSGNLPRDRRRAQAESANVTKFMDEADSRVKLDTVNAGFALNRWIANEAMVGYVADPGRPDSGPAPVEWFVACLLPDGRAQVLAESSWERGTGHTRWGRIHDAIADETCKVAFGKARPPWPQAEPSVPLYDETTGEAAAPRGPDPLAWGEPWSGYAPEVTTRNGLHGAPPPNPAAAGQTLATAKQALAAR